MKILTLSCVLIAIFVLSGAHANENNAKPEFVVTYVVYPGIEPYIDLISSVYQELGINTSIVATPNLRGLVLLNEGQTDADVIRLKPTILNYPNTLLVEPALVVGKLVLVCQRPLLCDSSVLQDSEQAVLIADNIRPLLREFAPLSRFISVSTGAMILDMLKADRASYGIFLVDQKTPGSPKLQVSILSEVPLHHVLNKKHVEMLPSIQHILRQKLAAQSSPTDSPAISAP